jgi:enoyl-CoA hydratase/carnithine racemase
MPTTLKLDASQPGTVVLTLDRPKSLNALNEVMVAELQDALATIGRDHAARVVVLTGSGRGFCAGLDLRNFGASMPDDGAPAIDVLRFQEMMAALPQAFRALPQPVIAAVNGPAVGGFRERRDPHRVVGR